MQVGPVAATDGGQGTETGRNGSRWPSRPGSPTRAWRNAEPTARRPATGCRGPATADGSRPLIVPTQSSCSRSRTAPASPTWCPSATGGCWSHRSPSTAGRPRSWPPTSPAPPSLASRCSSAATRTCAALEMNRDARVAGLDSALAELALITLLGLFSARRLPIWTSALVTRVAPLPRETSPTVGYRPWAALVDPADPILVLSSLMPTAPTPRSPAHQLLHVTQGRDQTSAANRNLPVLGSVQQRAVAGASGDASARSRACWLPGTSVAASRGSRCTIRLAGWSAWQSTSRHQLDGWCWLYSTPDLSSVNSTPDHCVDARPAYGSGRYGEAQERQASSAVLVLVAAYLA
jgi:hypothetical protein